MTYEELLGYCQRAVSIESGVLSLHDCLRGLFYHTPGNRAIAAEALARFLVEYVEAQTDDVPPTVKH